MKKQKIIISWRFLKKDGRLGAKHWKYAKSSNKVDRIVNAAEKGYCVGELCINYLHGRKNEAPFNNVDALKLALRAFLEQSNIDSITGDEE